VLERGDARLPIGRDALLRLRDETDIVNALNRFAILAVWLVLSARGESLVGSGKRVS
jgi:hypothetical protein